MLIHHCIAPYFINGHKNIIGLHMADEVNGIIANAECATDYIKCRNILNDYQDAPLFELKIKGEYIALEAL